MEMRRNQNTTQQGNSETTEVITLQVSDHIHLKKLKGVLCNVYCIYVLSDHSFF